MYAVLSYSLTFTVGIEELILEWHDPDFILRIYLAQLLVLCDHIHRVDGRAQLLHSFPLFERLLHAEGTTAGEIGR